MFLLIMARDREKTKITILPLDPWYILFVYIISGAFVLFLLIAPFWFLIANEPLEIYGLVLKNGIIQFIITFPVSIWLLSIAIKGLFYRVSFLNNRLRVPASEIQKEKLDIDCSKIIGCKIIQEGFYYYFAFRCVDGKIRKVGTIIGFTKKQLIKILKMIQERGGLQEQIVENIFDDWKAEKRRGKDEKKRKRQ